jgi:hypothetical protein
MLLSAMKLTKQVIDFLRAFEVQYEIIALSLQPIHRSFALPAAENC